MTENVDQVVIEKIIQIVESRTDLTPAEYLESRRTWFSKILDDKDLTKELIALYVKRQESEIAIMKFVTSVNTGDLPSELRK